MTPKEEFEHGPLKMPKYYPNPICSDCAQKIGGRMPEGYICTWWEAECDARIVTGKQIGRAHV